MKAFLSKGNEAVEIKPASTVVVLRKAQIGFEVLLLCRSKKSTFADSVWVFPGGGVEDSDYDTADKSKQDIEQAARRAGVRETFEECSLVLDEQKLLPYSHWTTPVGPPKRYATWFYFYLLEGHGEVVVDNQEIVDYQWLGPRQALERQANGELALLPPTFITLESLCGFTDAQCAIDTLKTTEFTTILPKATKQDDVTIMLYPGDAGYEACDASAEGARHRFLMSPKKWQYEKSGV